MRTLTNFRRVLLRLRLSYYREAKRWPRLQDYYAEKIADVEAAITAIDNRLGLISGAKIPGGNDGRQN